MGGPGIMPLGQVGAQFMFNVILAALFMTLGVRPRVCFCVGLPLAVCSALARLRFLSLTQWITLMRSTPATLDDFAVVTVQSAWRGVMSRARTRKLLEQKVLDNLANGKSKSTIAATASAATLDTARASPTSQAAAPAARHRRVKPKRNSNVDVFVRQRMQRTDAGSSVGLGGHGSASRTPSPTPARSSQAMSMTSPAAPLSRASQPLTPPDAVRNWKTGRHILRQARPASARISLQPAG